MALALEYDDPLVTSLVQYVAGEQFQVTVLAARRGKDQRKIMSCLARVASYASAGDIREILLVACVGVH